MQSEKMLYKNNPTDKISWVDDPDKIGVWEFTFDGKKFFNMFRDYPDRLDPEQRRVFDAENPYWKDFFNDR